MRLLAGTPRNVSCTSLDPGKLKQAGITTLALDFDGVLAPHGAAAPLPETIAWMSRCAGIFGQERVFILSNKPTDGRRRWFAGQFPQMRFVDGVRKKPYPDGVIRIAELSGSLPIGIAMIDDRLMTGCLAAINAGARPFLIRNPAISLRERPVAELFFMLLRRVEQSFVQLLSIL